MQIDKTHTDKIQVICCPVMFSDRQIIKDVEPGNDIRSILTGIGLPDDIDAGVCLNGVPVIKDEWMLTYPGAGDELTVHVVPQFSGGGGKNPIQLLLSIASLGLGGIPSFAALSTLSQFAIRGAIGLAGTLIGRALAPPPAQRLGELAGTNGKQSATYTITGTRNQANPFGAVPQVLGKHRIYPPLAGAPYTEVSGGKQFIRMLFALYGEVDISDLRIGETPIGLFKGVSYQIRNGTGSDPALQIYTRTVKEESLSIDITTPGETKGAGADVNGPGSWAQRVTDPDTDEFIVDVNFPLGLATWTVKGPWGHRVTINIEYKLTTSGTWLIAPNLIHEVFEDRRMVRTSSRVVVAAKGQYDVRIRVFDSRGAVGKTDITSMIDTTIWSSLKSVIYESPIQNISNIATVALRIQSSEQLNQVIEQFNFLAKSKVKDWNGASWVPSTISSNPASLYREVLQGPAAKKPTLDSGIDLPGLQVWHDYCKTNGFTFNAVIDTTTTKFELLRDIAAAGRASYARPNGKYSVVIDQLQTAYRQHFTPRNSWGYSVSKSFQKIPHAINARFIDEDEGYQQNERIVYDDGFTKANASDFETMEMFGISESDLIWKHVRKYIAEGRLRPEVHKLNVDMEYLVSKRAQKVHLAHDVLLIGLGSSRIKTVTLNGSNEATDITIDDVVPMEAGKTYGVVIRLDDGTSVSAAVNTAAGEQSSLTFTTPIPATPSPAGGELLSFGEFGKETSDMIITGIAPKEDLTATLTLMDAAPAVHTADAGIIPDFDSNITLPPEFNRTEIPKPIILSVKSDESVLLEVAGGGLITRALFTLQQPTGDALTQTILQAQWRVNGLSPTGEEVIVSDWINTLTFSGEAIEISITELQDGYFYDFRFRYVSSGDTPGSASEWATINHKVIGKTSLPPDPTNMRLDGDMARWQYPTPPIDMDGFKVRYRQGTLISYANGIDAHDGLISDNQFDISSIPATRPMVIMVKAVDIAGNESKNESFIITGLGDPVITNLVSTTDYKTDNWPGTIVNGSIVSTEVRAADDGSLYLAEEDAPYLPDPTALYLPVNYQEMSYTFEYLPDAIYLPASLTLQTEFEGEYSIKYRGQGDSLYLPGDDNLYLPDLSASYLEAQPDFVPWLGRLEPTRQRYDFQITTNASNTRGTLIELKTILDAPDVIEALDDIAINAAGTRIPITKTYKQIFNVTLTLQDDGGDAVSAIVMDKDPVLGPLVKTVDGSRVGVAGLVDVNEIRGI